MSNRQNALDSALRRLQSLPEPIGGRPDIGCVVWERRPDEADHDRRGGMVVDPPDEHGTVLCVQIGQRRGAAFLHVARLAVRELDPAMAEPANRAKMAATAQGICRALGAGRLRSRWSEEDLRWLERARDLATG